VGERKVAGLLAAGANIRVVSKSATAKLIELANAGKINWVARAYQSGDLDGAELVFAATNDRAVNAQVARDAHVARILCNVADAPDEGDFHVPAVLRQDDLTIAVGTGGRSPSRARRLRDRIAAWLAGEHLS
jgi:cobalt-precorrin 5A hydrolase/precorrin-3B C17-methyltransferase